MRIQLFAAVLALGTAMPAFAADAVVDEDVVVDSAYNWSGLYVGAQLGYVWGDAAVDYSEYEDGRYAWDANPDGIAGGIYAGANWQLNNGIVVGAETELNLNDGSDTAIYISEYVPTYPGYYDMEIRQNWSGSTRLRLGYAVDRWLPYITGGVAYSDYESNLYGEANGDGTLLGYTLGAGVEYAVTDNWRVRLSYLFTDYDTDTFNTNYNDGSGYYDGPFDIDLDTQALQFGVSFNW